MNDNAEKMWLAETAKNCCAFSDRLHIYLYLIENGGVDLIGDLFEKSPDFTTSSDDGVHDPSNPFPSGPDDDHGNTMICPVGPTERSKYEKGEIYLHKSEFPIDKCKIFWKLIIAHVVQLMLSEQTSPNIPEKGKRFLIKMDQWDVCGLIKYIRGGEITFNVPGKFPGLPEIDEFAEKIEEWNKGRIGADDGGIRAGIETALYRRPRSDPCSDIPPLYDYQE